MSSLFDIGWKYRKPNLVINASLGRQFILNINFGSGVDSATSVFLNGNCKSDFSDIRFTLSDGLTLMNYTLYSIVPGVSCKALIEMAFSVSQNIYMYYGNPNASNIGTLIQDPTQLQSIINVNTSVPAGASTIICPDPFYDSGDITGPIPSTLYKAILSTQGLTLYNDIINNSNGVSADDMFVFFINGANIANIGIIAVACGFNRTASSPSSVDITSNLSGLIGQNVVFRTKGYDIGTAHALSTGAVYIFASYDFINKWGSQETQSPLILNVGSSTPSSSSSSILKYLNMRLSGLPRGINLAKISGKGMSIINTTKIFNITASFAKFYGKQGSWFDSLLSSESISIGVSISASDSFLSSESVSIINV